MSKLYLLLITITLLFSCSDETPQTGGVTSPNFIKGRVVSGELNSKNATVTVYSAVVSDSINRKTYETTTDENGEFTVLNPEIGNYVVSVKQNSLAALSPIISYAGGDQEISTLSLGKTVSITGRVMHEESYSVSLIGVENRLVKQNGNIYTVDSVAKGDYSFIVSSENRAGVLQLSVTDTVLPDSLFVRDVELADAKVVETTEKSLDNYLISPIFYYEDPLWYNGKDFSLLDYGYEKSEMTSFKDFEITDYTLTVPFDLDGDLIEDSFRGDDILSVFSENYFIETDSSYRLKCFTNSITTYKDSLPRCQLANSENENGGEKTISFSMAVHSVPTLQKELSFFEIAQYSNSLLSLRVVENRLLIYRDDVAVHTILENYNLGTKFSLALSLNENMVTIYFNGKRSYVSYDVATLLEETSEIRLGAFPKSSVSSGEDAGSFGEIEIFK